MRADGAQRPLRLIPALLLACLLLWAVVMTVGQYVHTARTFEISFSDNGLFADMGRIQANGGVLYRDVWDNKPPGMFVVIAGFVRVMGNTVAAIAASTLFMDVFLALAAAAAAYAISLTWIGALIGAAFGLLFSAQISSPETTVLMAAFGATAMTLALLGRGRLVWMLAAGLVFVCGVMTKQPLAFELPALLAFAAIRAPSGRLARLRALAGVAVGLALGGALVLVWALSHGSLASMWFHLVTMAREYVLTETGQWHFGGDFFSLFHDYFLGATLPLMAAYFLLAAGSAVILLRAQPRSPLLWAALGWVLLSFIGASIARGLKPYYYREMVPPLIALIALAGAAAARMSAGRQAALAACLLAGAVWFGVDRVGWPSFSPRPTDELAALQPVIDLIEQRTAPQDCLWLWGNLRRFTYLTNRASCTSAPYDGYMMDSSVFPVTLTRIEFMRELFDHPPKLHILHSAWGYFKEEQKFADRYRGPLLLTNNRDAVFSVDLSKFHRLRANFGGEIGLFGYDLPPQAAYCPGATLRLAMTWERLSQPQHEYQMFARLITADETAQIASYEGVPADRRPTNSWTDAGELVLGPTFELQIPPDTAPGSYKLTVGLYDTAAPNTPLPTLDAQGQPIKPYAELQAVTIACP